MKPDSRIPPGKGEEGASRPGGNSDKDGRGDASSDARKRHENRERLNVDEEHRTPEMERGHRGTFP